MPGFSKTTIAVLLATGISAGSAQSAAAQLSQNAPGTVVREGDADMTCRQMADEGAALSAGMGASGPGLLGRVGGIARAGATMLMPAAGLAVAGAEALTSPGKARREAEADTRRDRWNYLNGLYAGRGCDSASAQTPMAPPTVSVAAPVILSDAPVTAPNVSLNGVTAVPQPPIKPAAFPH